MSHKFFIFYTISYLFDEFLKLLVLFLGASSILELYGLMLPLNLVEMVVGYFVWHFKNLSPFARKVIGRCLSFPDNLIIFKWLRALLCELSDVGSIVALTLVELRVNFSWLLASVSA